MQQAHRNGGAAAGTQANRPARTFQPHCSAWRSTLRRRLVFAVLPFSAALGLLVVWEAALVEQGLVEQVVELRVPEAGSLAKTKRHRGPVLKVEEEIRSRGLGTPLYFVDVLHDHLALVASLPRPSLDMDPILIERRLPKPESAMG